ncbi:hypothetical protein [Pseudogulbenkiania ferrooxidans]|uniref:Flagellar hook-length control protein-like C-terminal domain-containing protein n=1 Tax=Pseudogulbenkiania ferrooxidans EGD-HP2 TaxID=1388764 RepID=A0ABN0NBP8_9NEIS|nr:hypothetical protein [Pseudogulbenkiania ferrooxidans]ERE19479.1 hypothetical protein O166_20155 [Pseudogulbenkiania ferrooxidans EGD-HP2]
MQAQPTSAAPRASSRDRDEPHADRRGAQRFRALLDDAQPQQEFPAPSLSPWPLFAPPADSSDASPSGPASARAHPNLPPPPAPAAPVDSQALALRASTGPLAGLLVQAEWRGARLSLRLSAPAPELAGRLARERENLGAALSAALGVDVVVELGDGR